MTFFMLYKRPDSLGLSSRGGGLPVRNNFVSMYYSGRLNLKLILKFGFLYLGASVVKTNIFILPLSAIKGK